MTSNNDGIAAVTVAKAVNSSPLGVTHTTSHGIRFRVQPVTTSLIDEVTSRIKDPEIPMWHNEDKGRDEPNPSDPVYLKEMEATAHRRGVASIDALIMFGIDLVDGVPEDDAWLKKLQYMEKRGTLSLKGYDLKDPVDLEFLYKKMVVSNNDVLNLVSQASGITAEDVELAEASFRGDAERPAD